MASSILMLLYGLSAWGAALNCQAWAKLLVRHLRIPRSEVWWRDNALLIRVGLTLLSTGVASLAGIRLMGAVLKDVPIVVPSQLGIGSIFLMACAEPFFLRVDENHAKAIGKRSFVWRLYWAGTVSAVALFAIAVATGSLP